MNTLLIQFDIGISWTSYSTGVWVNYSPGIYYTDFSGTYSDVDSSFKSGAPTRDVSKVGGVFSDTTRLKSVDSISDLDTEPSFYWDSANTLLYVRLQNYEKPTRHAITIGVAHYVCKSNAGPVVVDGVLYENRVINSPQLTRQIAKWFFGITLLDDVNFELSNLDGALDEFPNYDVYFQECRFYAGLSSYSTISQFRALPKAYITDFKVGQESVTVTASDPRTALSQDVLQNQLTTSDWPDLDDNDVSKNIPIAYGTCRRATPICVNKGAYDKASAQTLTFILADTTYHDLHSIDTVYYNGQSVSFSGVDLTAGTFTYSKSADEEIDFDKFTVDFHGFEDSSGNLIENAVEVAIDVIANYGSIPYTTANYNLTKCNQTKNKVWSVGIHVTDQASVSDIVESVMNSALCQFIAQDDSRFAFIKMDENAAVKCSIVKDDIVNLRDLEAEYVGDEFLSSCTVNYSNGLSLINTDYQTEVGQRYKRYLSKEFDTYLTAAYHANTFAIEIMESSKEVRPLFMIELDPLGIPIDAALYYISLEIGDVVNADLARIGGTFFGNSRMIIEGRKFDSEDGTFKITARRIGAVADLPSPIYTQGVLYGEEMYGEDVYAVTEYGG